MNFSQSFNNKYNDTNIPFRLVNQPKPDSWFQYYYDAIGYPHADDPKGKSRTISPKWRWRFGARAKATITRSNPKLKIFFFFSINLFYLQITRH